MQAGRGTRTGASWPRRWRGRCGGGRARPRGRSAMPWVPRSRGWRVFPEVPAALTELRARGWKLAILSNTDPELLDASVDGIDVPNDERIAASDIGSYKPAFGHWETFFRRTGATARATSMWRRRCSTTSSRAPSSACPPCGSTVVMRPAWCPGRPSSPTSRTCPTRWSAWHRRRLAACREPRIRSRRVRTSTRCSTCLGTPRVTTCGTPIGASRVPRTPTSGEVPERPTGSAGSPPPTRCSGTPNAELPTTGIGDARARAWSFGRPARPGSHRERAVDADAPCGGTRKHAHRRRPRRCGPSTIGARCGSWASSRWPRPWS